MKDLESVRFPVLVSPKLDGIRCLIDQNGTPVTRSLKAIPNIAISRALQGLPPLDGELVVGDPTAKDCYRKTNSGVMSYDGEPDDWAFWVFDCVELGDFRTRLGWAGDFASSKSKKSPYLRAVPHKLVCSVDEVQEFEAQMLAKGYEGIMGRDPVGPYKYGRATLREGWLWKLKRFEDSEAVILDFDERMHNANAAKTNALGYKERSSHKENLVPMGTLGALKVRDVKTGVEFDIGTGFSDAERAAIWKSGGEWLGKIVKYKFLPVGVKDKPRHPVYLGPRTDI
jgi:DNA ligase-1